MPCAPRIGARASMERLDRLMAARRELEGTPGIGFARLDAAPPGADAAYRVEYEL